ncbi:DUF58 domain-containing protein [Spirillospora sp. NBC_00431]
MAVARRPTRRGWGLVAAGSVLCGGGLGLGYPAPGALGALTFPTVIAAAVLAGRPPAARVRRHVTAVRVGAGESVTVTLELDGAGATAVERLTGPAGSGSPVRLGAVRGRIRYRLGADRRGVVEAGPLVLTRTDPLGLVRASRPADDEPVRVLVHPRHLPLTTVPAADVGGEGASAALVRAAGGSFAGLRDHVPGDDIRRVHWRTSARRGRLMVRESAGSTRPGLTVLLDDRHGPAELDLLGEVAASIVRSDPGEPVELRLAGGGRVPATAPVTACLDLLAEAEARPGADFGAACRALRTGPPGRAVILLPGRSMPDAATALAALAGRPEICLVGVVGASNVPAPPVPPGAARLLHAPDPVAFAERWNESGWWRR